MNLREEIIEILKLDKFKNLTDEEKDVIIESILANCLILSSENQQKFLNLIKEQLVSIVNLGTNTYYSNGVCYGGIVETKVVRTPIDKDGNIFPLNYYLKYREHSTPLGRLTKSILHEFGHVVIRKTKANLLDAIYNDDAVYIDLGGLVITDSFRSDYGQMFTEILNEFTNFLSFKAYLGYHENTKNEKMREFAKRNGLEYDDNLEYLNILPDDIFTSYTEDYFSRTTLEEGTSKMFNPLYTKYTPLVKLIMHSFQNPLFSEEKLKEEFKKGNGLSVTINNEPINGLLYGYYESSFYPEEIFNSEMKGQTTWRDYCIEFDRKIMDTDIDNEFIESSINQFSEFYKKRVSKYLTEGKISEQQAEKLLMEFYKTVDSCKSYYSQIQSKLM